MSHRGKYGFKDTVQNLDGTTFARVIKKVCSLLDHMGCEPLFDHYSQGEQTYTVRIMFEGIPYLVTLLISEDENEH